MKNIPIVSIKNNFSLKKNKDFYEPLIITGLYSKDLWNNFLGDYGKLKITINRNYYDSFNKSFDKFECTISDYVFECKNNPKFDLMCTENILPPNIAKRTPIPYFLPPKLTKYATRCFFMGNRSTAAPLHFDWDMNHVILTQLVGEKKVVLFEPGIAKKLIPLNNSSLIALHNMREKELEEFVSYNNGYIAVLKPGDSVFIPKLWWHFLKYDTFAASINIRFGNNKYERLLATLPQNYLLQNIVYSLFKKSSSEELQRSIGIDILSRFYSYYENPFLRYSVMMEVYTDLFNSICEEAIKTDYVGVNFKLEQELGKGILVKHYDVKYSTKNIDEIKSILIKNKSNQQLITLLNYFEFTHNIEALSNIDLTILANSVAKLK